MIVLQQPALVTENCETDRLKTAVIKKLSQLQENSERQVSDLRNKIHEQRGYFAKIRILKKNQILELKNLINESNNEIVSIGNRADYMEERISKLEGRNLEMIQVEEERTKIFFLNEEIL